MIRRAFVVERPLQILIVLSILDQIDSNAENNLLIAGSFYDAENISKRIFESFGKRLIVQYFPTYKDAIDSCYKTLYSEVFLHWDVGFGTNIRIIRILLNSKLETRINVFEEGIGTYRDDIYPIWKKRIFSFFGLPVNNGGNIFIKKIYLYDPQEYRSRVTRPAPIVEKIKTSLADTLDKYRTELNFIFNVEGFLEDIEDRKKENCLIYLSNWYFSEENIEKFCCYDGYKILKLHPKIKCNYKSIEGDFTVAPNSLPAEILIDRMSTIFKSVEVVHNGSSVVRYIQKANIKYLSDIDL